ncbi:MAG: hypothetical protein WAS05_00065 [Candidatus Nanopelagicales bacterium]
MTDEKANEKLSEEELEAATGGAGEDLPHANYDRFFEQAMNMPHEPGKRKGKNNG